MVKGAFPYTATLLNKTVTNFVTASQNIALLIIGIMFLIMIIITEVNMFNVHHNQRRGLRGCAAALSAERCQLFSSRSRHCRGQGWWWWWWWWNSHGTPPNGKFPWLGFLKASGPDVHLRRHRFPSYEKKLCRFTAQAYENLPLPQLCIGWAVISSRWYYLEGHQVQYQYH